MLILLVYWFILFLFASLSGIALQNTFGLSKTNMSFTLLFGIIFQTLFLSLCAFFFRINYEIFIVNCFIQLLFFFKYKTEFSTFCKLLFKSFSKNQTYLFLGLTLLIALKSAQLPTIFDNESYYIQTIKWLNEYGFVKGVANVHPFLGQFSFWHVLQSGFNAEFISASLVPLQINDINGFILLIGIYYFIQKHIKKAFNWSFFGIVFLVFYYQFIDSPSPDLPILVLSAIIFNEFIENSNEIKSTLLFIIFMIFIKVTIAPILLIALIYLWKNKTSIPYFGIISIVFGSIWIAKNVIITGFPLFPLTFIVTKFDWKMSLSVIKKLTQLTIDAGYSENVVKTVNLSMFEKLNLWFHLGGINAVFNKGILFLFVIIPFTKFFKTNKNFIFLYFILLVQFLFLLVTSPQYRFFLPTFILFSTVIIYEVSIYLKFPRRKLVVVFSLLLISINLFFDVKNTNDNSSFHLSQLIIPESNTKYKNIEFEKKSIENFNYNNVKLPNLHETSNGDLPCVNDKLYKYYKCFPQQRTNDMKDGFYAKELRYE